MNRIIALAVTLSFLLMPVAVRAEQNALGDALAAYGKIHEALAADRADGVAEAAAEIASLARAAAAKGEPKTAFENLANAAGKLQGTDLVALRAAFKELSTSLASVVNVAGAQGQQLYYCPMADGYWLQQSADAKTRNPYYGKSMLGCGEKVSKVEG
jgi:hypothetical protein